MDVITYKIKNIAVLLFTMFIFLAFLLNTEAVAESAVQAMSLCFFRIIPSIFPFMVISTVLLKTRLFKHIFIKNKIFDIILISWISGFLVGPKYLDGQNNGRDLTDTNVLLSNAGIGFVISYIGTTLWHSPMFGAYLYLVQIASSVVIYKINHKESLELFVREKKKASFLTAFCSSVQESTQAMLGICGFTVFFSILKEVTVKVFNIQNRAFSVVLSALFEVSSGAYSSVNCDSVYFGAFIIGFAVGFGGLCMCMQTFSCVTFINKRRFIIKKLMQGLICGFFSYLYVCFSALKPKETVVLVTNNDFEVLNLIISSAFIFCSINYLKKVLKNIDFS